eukprot:CAMPEP_0170554774 /NCGR_PEP_ID=MMETSP0211-20121228/12650_1 /TAXON_ID=311385 /ORGANISM="Pseudokeronopsis sp., Strain OXSARD2" /LENGTH=128 /DNA_ID=CAMNT_0010864111 /DNA_START=78 /DNA_END=465 /DNA_ORIENTATION=-
MILPGTSGQPKTLIHDTKKIRKINKPVLTQLQSFVNHSNNEWDTKRDIAFGFPPISYSEEDDIEEPTNKGTALWSQIGKQIIGRQGHELPLKDVVDQYKYEVKKGEVVHNQFFLGKRLNHDEINNLAY